VYAAYALDQRTADRLPHPGLDLLRAPRAAQFGERDLDDADRQLRLAREVRRRPRRGVEQVEEDAGERAQRVGHESIVSRVADAVKIAPSPSVARVRWR
jgi:hypothetical protein